MSYGEDILKLRLRFAEAVNSGALDGSKETLETLLIQIMNDAERNRQNCVTQSDNLRKQMATLDGQAAAFASVTSIVYNVLNGFIKVAERAKEEENRLKEEAAEREALIAVQAPKEDVSDSVDEDDESDKNKKLARSKKK